MDNFFRKYAPHLNEGHALAMLESKIKDAIKHHEAERHDDVAKHVIFIGEMISDFCDSCSYNTPSIRRSSTESTKLY